MLPDADRPTAGEVSDLRGCDSEADYYGIGRMADPVRARKCASLEVESDATPVFGGSAILMMVYANGKGVPRDVGLASRFACAVGGAPTELSGRIEHIEALGDARVPHRDLDVCDDVRSGVMSGHCAAHRERLAAGGRLARKKKAAARLPAVELDAVERAAESFFDARESSEVDLSGTLRDALRVEERTRLEDALVAALERVRDPAFPEKTGDPRATEAELESVYMRLVTCRQIAVREATVPGAVTLNGIRNTERLWLSYRDAWIALGTRARSGTSPDLWRTWLTLERTEMLRQLATGC